MLITISRQFGAGGAEVAKRVADRLQWRVADNEFVERVAVRAGLTPDEVAVREERVPNFIERLAWALASASAELAVPTGATMEGLSEPLMVRVTESVVAEIAREGRVVLVGRGAAAILGEQERTLHVMLVASAKIRAERIAGRLQITVDEARKRIQETDARRAQVSQGVLWAGLGGPGELSHRGQHGVSRPRWDGGPDRAGGGEAGVGLQATA